MEELIGAPSKARPLDIGATGIGPKGAELVGAKRVEDGDEGERNEQEELLLRKAAGSTKFFEGEAAGEDKEICKDEAV